MSEWSSGIVQASLIIVVFGLEGHLHGCKGIDLACSKWLRFMACYRYGCIKINVTVSTFRCLCSSRLCLSLLFTDFHFMVRLCFDSCLPSFLPRHENIWNEMPHWNQHLLGLLHAKIHKAYFG